MLTIAGLGVWDENDISLRCLDAIRETNIVYVELYTNLWNGDVNKLEKLAGRKITTLPRKEVEEGFGKILDEARNESVCLLVPGDPLAATTHMDLVIQARKMNVATRIIHSSSIFTAAAESGLQLYKFGKTATIPLSEKTGGVLPQSVYDTIKGNLELGLHTLLLLDIDVENDKNLGVMDALRVLQRLDKAKILADKKLVVVSKLGSAEQVIKYGFAEELLKAGFGLPAVLIVPGKLHFAEQEFVEFFSFK
ncbi:MAG: diphthine synthase [Candidatus Aenigmarchaeota archaeon]|nr:diphthine synthase [Candidatus Aenigmarchaeota archaeon]